jgi:CubicO group peptidase (beta-lactamase class C family)
MIRRTSSLWLIGLLLLPAAGVRAQTSAERITAVAEDLERFLALRVERAELPGLAFGVVANGELAWVYCSGAQDLGAGGEITPQTVFRIGSVTKTFTGAAILQQRDRGALALDDPLVEHLPELAAVALPTADSPAITWRHAVTHATGLPRVGDLNYFSRPDQGVTEAELLAALAAVEPESSPGSRTRYSNLAMALAGLALGRATGQPYRELVTAELLQPLGMASTVWDPEQVPEGLLATGYRREEGALVAGHHWRLGAAEAMGGAYSSLEDMARYAAFQLDAWPPRDDPDEGPLRRASVRESHLVAGHARPGGQTFGVNWAVIHDETLGHLVFHTGATWQYACSVFLLPERNIGVVALTNAGAPDSLDRMAKEALEKLARQLPGGAAVDDEALQWGLERVLLLLQSPSPELIGDTFSPMFLEQIPSEALRHVFLGLGDLGACRPPELLRLNAPGWGTFRLECETEDLEILLVVDDASPRTIQGFRISPESQGNEVDSTAP